REVAQRLGHRHGNPADGCITDIERDPVPGQHGVVAGAHMALETSLFHVRIQTARLSNTPVSCHMRSMRRSSVPPAPAVLPPSLRAHRSTWQTISSLLPYLWPAGNRGARIRVAVALVFMILAKVAAVYVPVLYGRIVDALAPRDQAHFALVLPMLLILGYGA